MKLEANFNINDAHKYFSAFCFNKAWDLIDKTDRTPEENQEMIRTSFASLWHWTQRPDCTRKNMSISYWQLSRIYAILGQAENARSYAQLCLQASQTEDIPPFYIGYAYEALARSEAVAHNREKMEHHLEEARRFAEAVTDPEEKKMLLNDLETIRVK